VHRPHAGLARHAIELLERRIRITDRQFDPGQEAIGMRLVSLHRGIVDDAREAYAILSRDPLPRHSAVEGEHVHRHAVLVHPLDPLIEVGIELHRDVDARRRPTESCERVRVGLRHPVRVRVDRTRRRLSCLCR
jgi:hypothetical protein